MFKIIVGLDDRDEGLDAAALAREMAELEEAEVIAASSFVFSGEHLELAYPEALNVFMEVTDKRATEVFGGLTYRKVQLHDSPAHGLQRLAEEEGADLIVLGSTHRGPIGRVMPGSTGELLLAGAPCPIAVAPRGYAEGGHERFARVGVGYDGRHESQLALSEAIRIAKRTGAKLEVITVVPPYNPIQGGTEEEYRDRYRERLANALEGARGEDLEADGVLTDAETAEALTDHASEADLLVLGSRGYGPLRHVLLGSTSAKVIREATCPVLVVPRGAEERVRDHAGATAIAAR
jgi:nucleotide-binding universal stress UspA family protein